MRTYLSIFCFVLLFALALIYACSGDEPVTPAQQTIQNTTKGDIPIQRVGAVTCSTVSCIENFLDNSAGHGTLVISDYNSPYTLTDHYLVTNPSDEVKVTIEAENPASPPTVRLTKHCTYGSGEYATLHFAGPADNETFVRFEDMIFEHNAYMDLNGALAGIMFEVFNVYIDNTTFTNSDPATTFFMTPGLVTIDDSELSSGHQFSFGPEDWCGEPTCGGYGNPMPADGSYMDNCSLEGDVIFDVYRSSGLPDTAAFSFTGNDPLTSLYLNSNSGSKTKIVMNGNTFANADPVVDIDGGFTVDAWNNTTQKGPCYADALSDFNTTGADAGSAALNLSSWRYDGTLYCMPEITNLDHNRVGNTVTVTWETECTATSLVAWGYSSASLPDTATGSNGTLHSVQFTVGTTEGCVYLRAISAIPSCSCDADISDIYTNTKDIVISNVVATWNGALACSFTITWTTNVKSNSTVNYGASCAALNNVASDPTYTTSHSVICDASVVSGGAFAYKVKSANSCDTEQSSCYTTRRPTCMGQ